jgi:hypothetical protein
VVNVVHVKILFRYMKIQTSKIEHPLGISVETPLMVPSFSSKGFIFNKSGVSETADVLNLSREFLTESLLVSAYDLYYKHLPFSDEYLSTDVAILDSGGYETSDVYDLSASSKYSYPIKEWCQNKYEEIINQWPKHKAGIIVSYDHGEKRSPLNIQIEQANELFSKYPQFLNDFLIKPETEDQRYIQMDNIIAHIEKMLNFTFIGVTEKELGGSTLDRMVNVGKIRQALDDNKIESPIHVFGSLDPLTSILYFLAGAEVFDGLTWLKYSYFNGAAIYQTNYGALHNQLGIHVRDSKIRSQSIVNNIYTLDRMKYILKEFIVSKNFDLFNELSEGLGALLEKLYNKFIVNLK